MADHHQTAVQAVQGQFAEFFNPLLYHVTHRLPSIKGLVSLIDTYDLFLLDRDCTLQSYHGKVRVPEFEPTLQLISPQSELVSNSSFDEVKRIRDLYGELMPVSKLVRFSESEGPHLLRFVDGELTVLRYHPAWLSAFVDETTQFASGDTLIGTIAYNFKKPHPLVLEAVVDVNVWVGRIPSTSRILMVGDRYLTDIVAGNLAGYDTAKVRPYKPLSDKLDLIAMRYVLDASLGAVMSRLV